MLQVADCLSGVGTYLLGTVWQGCKLFKRCQNLSTEHCGAGVQAVYAVSEPTSHALLGRGAGCFSIVGTYLQGTVLQGYELFKRCWNLPPGHCVAGCRLFKRCPNLPAGHCVAECRLLKWCLNLPPGHYGAWVQAV